MRISDWSSDVCSSDLVLLLLCGAQIGLQLLRFVFQRLVSIQLATVVRQPLMRVAPVPHAGLDGVAPIALDALIGRQPDDPQRAVVLRFGLRALDRVGGLLRTCLQTPEATPERKV